MTIRFRLSHSRLARAFQWPPLRPAERARRDNWWLAWLAFVVLAVLVIVGCAPVPAPASNTYRVELMDGTAEIVEANRMRISGGGFGPDNLLCAVKGNCMHNSCRAIACWPLSAVKSWRREESR
jgi:hypothetical protein